MTETWYTRNGDDKISKAEILKYFYPVWKQALLFEYDEEEISEENCIEDYCKIYGAHKVEE